LENELVSTQTDLNPNTSNILLYKRVALVVLFVVFLSIYIWKRKKIYLILTLISCVGVLIYSIPNKTGILKKDSYIFILPTNKSTIFQKTDNNLLVEISIKRGEFVKIIVGQGDESMIGWVKEDDIIKN
jgi:hydrogenase-4 membrane subunit HyfE